MTEPLRRWQAQYLADFIHETIRPDWSVPGIMSALAAARDQADPADLAIVAIVAARRAENRTPGVIPLPGPHWAHTALSRRDSRHTTPDRTRTCGVCYLDYNECRKRWANDHEYESLDAVRERRVRAAEIRKGTLSHAATTPFLEGRPVTDVELP